MSGSFFIDYDRADGAEMRQLGLGLQNGQVHFFFSPESGILRIQFGRSNYSSTLLQLS